MYACNWATEVYILCNVLTGFVTSCRQRRVTCRYATFARVLSETTTTYLACISDSFDITEAIY